MIVCIAEKPSVAQDIAHVLGATERHAGYMEGNNYQVTWTFGHLCELKYPEDYAPQWKVWSLSSLPIVPHPFGIRLKKDKGIEKQFQVIEHLMKQAERIINCGDAGQEGELIQRWVMQKVGVTCPVQRLWISSLTEESIREGFQHLKDQSDYTSLYEAGLCRAIGDWLLGMNATRLYTLKYGRRERQASPLSVGRVQTPTLALIVNRQREIEQFKPEPYWVLATVYRSTLFTANKSKFLKEDEGLAALQQIEGKDFIVVDVTKKKGHEAPPRLFDLTSLQVECNKKFAFSADLTLSLIQSLYEKKVTTYPRVDTTYLSDDIYPKCGKILNGLKLYESLLLPLRGRKLLKSKKVFDTSKVTDHHAIIPTGMNPKGLTDAEMKVFDLVARRFIAVFYPDCLFTMTTVQGEVDKIGFKVVGKHIESAGWREVYADDKKTEEENQDEENNGKEEERLLPDFIKNESGPHAPQLSKKMTVPPKPYTEATLLRAMETAGKNVEDDSLREALKENGIGRPSTRAAIIETLFKRHYVNKIRKNLFATATGCQLIDIIHEELLKSAELTGLWEKKLRNIEYHKYSASTFISELEQMVEDLVRQVLRDNTNRHVTVVEGEKISGTKTATQTKRKYATKKAITSPPSSSKLQPDDKIIGQPCPFCHRGHIIKGKTAYGCSEFSKGCTFRLPFKQGEK
ncbi:MAG: DNA topoisomerase 3 [Bacteroidaceae bacterium]|jgi:DNA topoisomerase-3|nr:DNA topoisomerase 3 [Bacteroidaceae bacterium]